MKNEEIRFLNEQIADARENQVNSSTLNEIQNIGPQLGVLQEAILNLESEKTALVNENSRLKQENEELKRTISNGTKKNVKSLKKDYMNLKKW